jgi:hypothetical protein
MDERCSPATHGSDPAGVGGVERGECRGIDLAGSGCGEDEPAEDDEDSTVSRGRRCRDDDGVTHVRRSVGLGVIGWSDGARHDHGAGIAVPQMQRKRSLLQGIGAVGDDDSRYAWIEELVGDGVSQQMELRRREREAALREHRDDAHLTVGDIRKAFVEGVIGSPWYAASEGVGDAVDGAAGTQHHDEGKGGAIVWAQRSARGTFYRMPVAARGCRVG